MMIPSSNSLSVSPFGFVFRQTSFAFEGQQRHIYRMDASRIDNSAKQCRERVKSSDVKMVRRGRMRGGWFGRERAVLRHSHGNRSIVVLIAIAVRMHLQKIRTTG